MSKVTRGKVVELEYTLRLSDGEIADATEGEPLAYLHGYGEIIAGLEDALEGHSVGEKLSLTIEPAEGYGEYEDDDWGELPREAFPEDAVIEEGDEVTVVDEDGDERLGWIAEIGDEVVAVDFNHPLAGETLSFEIEILGVRDATAEEIDHGHAHGHEHDHDPEEDGSGGNGVA